MLRAMSFLGLAATAVEIVNIFRRAEAERKRQVAGRKQKLYKTKGGSYIRICDKCAKRLGLTPLASDRGKQRHLWGCEFCTKRIKRPLR